MKLFELIGNTPIVEIERLNTNPNVKIYAKLEGQNPGGSVKDRAAYGMINGAIEKGFLKRGDKIVEATSGNTGIALAMVGTALGIGVTLIMPDNSTIERVQTMEALGARVILTPAVKTIEYSRELAIEMSEKEGYYLLNQFDNPDNYMMHYRSTGPEIWKDTHGKVTHFVSSMGTTGTIMGVSKYLKEQNSKVQIVGCQPTDGSNIPGIRRWTPDYLPKIYNNDFVDRKFDVSAEQAIETMKQMSKVEGIFAGVSSGGAMHAALEIAKELTEGVIVTIACDRGDRYLSSGVFA
jgi:S-sulfo-L-cysteine synthase (O-acetyl-L-serine-dependent)